MKYGNYYKNDIIDNIGNPYFCCTVMTKKIALRAEQVAAGQTQKEDFKNIKFLVWPLAALCLCLSSDRWWRGWWFFHSHPWDSQSHRGSALSPPLHTLPLSLWYAVLNVGNIIVTHSAVTTESGLYIPLSTKLPHASVYHTVHFITCGERTCGREPKKCLSIACVTWSLSCSSFMQSMALSISITHGWSTVVRVREQCLSQGLSVMVLLSTGCWQPSNEMRSPCRSGSRGGVKVVMTTSPFT